MIKYKEIKICTKNSNINHKNSLILSIKKTINHKTLIHLDKIT